MDVTKFFEKSNTIVNKRPMILDLSNILYSSYYASGGVKNNGPLTDKYALWRYFIFNTILSTKTKFNPDEIIIALDHSSWRKTEFQYYKAKRHIAREKDKAATQEFFDTANSFIEDLKCLPYKFIHQPGAEGDDIVAILVEYLTLVREDIIIVSVDKDLQQLQKYKNVRNWNPVKKEFQKCDNPHEFLLNHFIVGDSGDGIPNILSPDNIFLQEGKCQKSITEKVRREIAELGLEGYCIKNNLIENYERNRKMIELSSEVIPKEVQEKVIYEYNNYKVDYSGAYTKIVGTMEKYNIRNLRDRISNFMF